MSQTKDFINKYLTAYLKHSRVESKGHFPPTERETEELIIYLRHNGVDPIIVGSVAVVKHLNPTSDDLNKGKVRPTTDLDLFISSALPIPPPGWRRDLKSVGVISWISPSGGYVDFLVAGQRFPDNQNPKKIGKDPESEKMGCPVADMVSIFQLKLNSYREKDTLDLVALARKIGIPKNLDTYALNSLQRDNLTIVKLWIAHERK